MSFAEPEDIFHMIEGMIQRVFKDTINTAINAPFTHIPFDEAMDKYGCDKPDIRYDLHLKDVSEIVKKSSFGVFNSVLSNGGVVKCVIPRPISAASRSMSLRLTRRVSAPRDLPG